ncbi:MAG: TrmH family RNA methyltransferase [Bacteroidota bacterium]
MKDHVLKAKDKFGTSLPVDRQAIIIVAYQLRTPENMGMILRLAGNIGAEKVWLVIEPDQQLKESKLKKTAQTAIQHIDWSFCLPKELEKHLPEGYIKIALDTTAQSANLFSVSLPEKFILFLGNEVHGLPDHIIDECDQALHIPMPGPTRSMNVAMAAAVALFQVFRR